MTCPLDFNDPFDVRESLYSEYIDWPQLIPNFRSAVRAAVMGPFFAPRNPYPFAVLVHQWRDRLQGGKCSLSDIDNWVDSSELSDRVRKNAIEAEAAWKNYVKDCRVFCLTEVDPCKSNESCTMWSHYADEHRGVALEFCLDDWFGDFLKPVTYSESAPAMTSNTSMVDFLLGHRTSFFDGGFSQVFTTKAQCWAYEKEWRVVSSKQSNPCPLDEHDLVQFSAKHLRSIVFGCRTPDHQVDKLKGLCRKHVGSHVTLLKLWRSSIEYRFECHGIA